MSKEKKRECCLDRDHGKGGGLKQEAKVRAYIAELVQDGDGAKESQAGRKGSEGLRLQYPQSTTNV